MDRRNFIRAAGVGAAATALAAPAIAQDRQVVQMVTAWPRDFPGLGAGAQRIADRITAASDGRLEVKLFAANELVPAFGAFDAVATGAAQLYHAADYYWQGKHKGYNFFCTVPMGLTAGEMMAWMHYGGGQELSDELNARFGLKGIMGGNTGAQMGGWFRKPITSLDDLQGLNFRIPGLAGEVYRRLGVNAVALPGGEIFPALQSGAIDAADWVGPYNDLAFGLQNILKHYMYPGFQEPGPAVTTGVNLAWWESLSDADRALIEAASLAENDVMLAEFNARNGEALERLVNEYGVQLHEFPEEVALELARVSDEVVRESAEDELGQRIVDSYFTFRDRVRKWTRVGEQEYTNLRAKALGA